MATVSTNSLTPTEEQVLRLLCGAESRARREALSIKQVARELGISASTVREHVANAKAKAGVNGPLHRLVVWYLTSYYDNTGGTDAP